jgi:hypothetical protein
MKKKTEHQPIFAVDVFGSTVQTGSTSLFSSENSSSFHKIGEHALTLKALFERHGLSIDSSPTLAELFTQTLNGSKTIDGAAFGRITFNDVFGAAQMDRVSSAALLLEDEGNAYPYLLALLKGSINLLHREQSKAKDTLWELELLKIFRNIGIKASLEEPDIVVEFKGAKIGIACKKFYSEANVSKVLSIAISQIERAFDFGIVAVNLDDLLPEDQLVCAATIESASAMLEKRLLTFMKKHERHLRRYLEPGRAMTALVSCGALVDVQTEKPRFQNARQTVAWHIPGQTTENRKQVQNFVAAFEAYYEK